MSGCRARRDFHKSEAPAAEKSATVDASPEHAVREYSARFHGCTCTLRVNLCGAAAHWSPTPTQLPWRDRHQSLTAYRRWRDECLRRFGREHGHVVRVVRDQAEFVFLRCRVDTSDPEIKLEWRRRGA
jgi:hypothetical protein